MSGLFCIKKSETKSKGILPGIFRIRVETIDYTNTRSLQFQAKNIHCQCMNMEFECSAQNSICCRASSVLFMFNPMVMYDRYYLYTSTFICCRERVPAYYACLRVFSQRVEKKWKKKERER